MTTKTNFDSDQVERLKVWFDINPTPNRNQVDYISAQMKVMSASVWMWFRRQQNRVKANPYITPQKVKTASLSKGLSSSVPHAHKVMTSSVSKRLDCNRSAHKNGDVQEHVTEMEDRRQDRLKAKKGHITGILRKPDMRQHSGARSAEGCLKQTVKLAKTRGGMRVKCKGGGDVDTVNESEVMQRLEPVQGCIKRKDKVADSVEHNRARSSLRYIGTKQKIDHQESSATKLPKDSIHREGKEAEPHQYIRRNPAQGSMTRTVKELDSQKSMRKKPISGTEKKILKEADSQNFLIVKPVLRGIERRDKVADPRERGGVKAAQGGRNTAEKVSEKQRSLLQSEKECLLKQNQLTHRVKNTAVPKKMDSSGKIIHGGHQREIEPEGRRQIGVASATVCINRTVEAERKHERQIKGPVTRRRVTEVLGCSQVNEHHRAAEKNLRHLSQCKPVVEFSSSIHNKKCKHKSRKGKRIKMLLSQKPNPFMNETKTGNVLKESSKCLEKPQLKCKIPARTSTRHTNLFSALSLPQGKANVSLSDSSDAEDFQDDQNKRTHKLTKKKMDMTDALGNSKSIPVLSRKRQHSPIADCAKRMTAGSNLRRIQLKSSSQVHQHNKKNLPVSPVNGDVSSTLTSQSSVISSTVSDPLNHCRKGRPKSPDNNSCEVDIRITKRLLQRKNSEEINSVKEVGKRSGPVISDDKIWNPYDVNFIFKRELSVNLIKINLSSYSDQREVTVSSKMNPTRRCKENKDSNPPCKDDKTDINANVSVNLSSVPKAVERSIWSSVASSVETSNKVWSSIASPTETSLKEIPFIDGSSLPDRESNKLWSSIASSAEKSHKDIPFMERSASPNGESTPSSSQDTVASNKGTNRENTESIFEEDSCGVSSSVDLEKVPADLSGKVEGIEETSSAVVKESKENEKMSGDVMEISEDMEKSPEEVMETMKEVEKSSAGELEDMEEHEKSSTDLIVIKEKYENTSDNLMESKDEFEEAPAVLMELMEEAEKSPADVVENCEANKVPVEPERSTEDVERTGADSEETPVEVDKISEELMERTKSSCGKDQEETGENPARDLQDLYENIDSPDYDIGSPYMVVDEVSCSDTEETEPNITTNQEDSSVSTHSLSKPASPFSKVVKNAETSEVTELDDNDGVILVSLSPPKKTRKESPGNRALKDQTVCCNTSVGKGISAGAQKPSASSPTNPSSSKATKKKDSHEVIDVNNCSESDEVTLVSTVAPTTPSSKDFVKGTPDLSQKESKKGSPKILQSGAPETSVKQDLPIAVENVTLLHTPSVRENLSKSQGVSESTETKSSDLVDENTTPDADMELDGDDIELDMSCETVLTISKNCDDHKLSEKLLVTSKQNVGCNDSSSDELVIDMEACNQMEQPLQDQNVSENTSASLRYGVDASLDPPEGSVDHNDSSSDELVIDMEACDLMECPPREQDAPEETSASPGDPAVDSSEDDVKHDNSKASDELNSYCDADRSLNAREDLKSEELDQAEQNVEHGDSVPVIDVNACDEVESPLQAKDASESDAVVAGIDSSQENDELRDSTSDGLSIVETTCEQTECSLAGNNPAEIDTTTSQSGASEENLDPVKETVVHEDSTSDRGLFIDATTCDPVECPLKDDAFTENSINTSLDTIASKANASASDAKSSSLVAGVVDQRSFEEGLMTSSENPPLEKESSGNDGGVLGEVEDPVLAKGSTPSGNDYVPCETEFLADKKGSPSAKAGTTSTELLKVLAEVDSSQENDELRDSTSDGLYIDETACEQTECSLAGNNPPEIDTTTSRSEASEENLDPVKQTVVHEDSTSNDDLFIDATTCDPVECPLKDNTFTENSVNTSLDSSIASKANTPASGAKSSSLVAGVVDQGSLEEGLMTSSENPPLEKESSGNDGGVLGEVEDPVPAKGSTPSCDDSVPCETEVHADKKGSLSVKAGTTSTEFLEVLEAGDLAVTAINSSATLEDHQPQTSSSSDAANHQPPKTDVKIKSEPDIAAEKDNPSGTNNPSPPLKNPPRANDFCDIFMTVIHQSARRTKDIGGDLKPSNKESSAEKVKHPRSLHELVLDLTQKLGKLAKKGVPSVSSLDLPKSTVSINHKARYSNKLSSLLSSSTEAAPQPPKPVQEPRRGTKRRVITNKNLKRPPIPEAVQIRIQQLNLYPFDHSWKRNAAVVELAQTEAQLDCQPGDIGSTKAHNLAANLELSHEPLVGVGGTTTGSLNFYYQPRMGPTNANSTGAMDRDSHGATIASNNANSCNQRVDAQPSSGSMNSGQPTIIKENPLVHHLLCGKEPVKQKRSRARSGQLKKDKKSRRRRKSSDDIAEEILSRADAFANGSFSEKDIREEWMQLLKVMEETNLSGNEEQPSSSGTTVPTSSVSASTSVGDLGSSAVVSVEGLPSAPPRVSETSSMTASASTTASAEDQLPAATGYQAATLGVPETSTASASEVDDLSDMPSILRVFSLRDEAQESCPTLEPSGLGSFDPDSAMIVEEQGPPSRERLRECLRERPAMNRKRLSSQTYGSTDGVSPLKSSARVVNGSTFREFPRPTMQQRQLNPQQVPSSCLIQSGNLSGTVQTIASNNIMNSTSGSVPSGISPNNYVINTPLASPSSSNTQGATCVLPSPPILVASQPMVSLVPVQPGAQQQVQPSLLGKGTLRSLLNPLILNQEIQKLRLSASPPLCTPYPISSVSANVISGHSGVTLNSLSRQSVPTGNNPGPVIGYLARNVQLPTPVNSQWTQPATTLQLTPVTSQTYNNGLNSQSKTIFYTSQGSTLSFLSGVPQ